MGVSDFSVLDKNSSILKGKNIDIVKESQSTCSFSITRSIDNSADDAQFLIRLMVAAIKFVCVEMQQTTDWMISYL